MLLRFRCDADSSIADDELARMQKQYFVYILTNSGGTVL
jgi:hypothetical protein